MTRTAPLLLIGALGAFGCSSADGEKTDAQYRSAVTQGMHRTLLDDIQALHQASLDLQAAAPTPADRGWDADFDRAPLAAMLDAWKRARGAYERTEGAIAPLFPELDTAIDARYDDFLADLGEADEDPFDDQGVTGMHAIERILFAPQIPAAVIEAESTLPGYRPAAWPASAAEAAEFKQSLCARLVADTATLEKQWSPQQIDLGGAFQGLISLMNEQREKVVKAASFEQESRYSERTLADIRDNLTGTRAAYGVFREWLQSKQAGPPIDGAIEAGFANLEQAYLGTPGDAVPDPPATWSSEAPTAQDLESPFGKLYTAVFAAVDPNRSGSIVDSMNHAAVTLGFPEFVNQ